MTAAQMISNFEALRSADSAKVAVSPIAGPTRYYLPCWRCRRATEVDRRIFALNDATTCPRCVEQLRRRSAII